ncbi:alpha-N-acetylglucosaminidase [Arachidicoccus ginsenosidivorans]|uniref:Alpha-N-acetylglucosaminidase n=1 Tax=Arachidicoccus ginsenosidivorans TaxID=496057 RepID=A0A5B8VV26_9BACT|nr:alpha-N-acetylglucosaminidase [Arachidicoccus ginsenosidivorans]QEC74028.1 alpha-N-acetylglucosaminidase [Arachidicoccus ginsenosidivorans]
MRFKQRIKQRNYRKIRLIPFTSCISCIICCFGMVVSAYGQPFKSVEQLAERRVPWLAPHLDFKTLAVSNSHNDQPSEKVQDGFELSSKNGRIVISASSASAAAMGLNWYLKYYCHRSMSHLGDNLSPVKTLPMIQKVVKVNSPFKVRYALNYCTLNYTMSFYNWKDWQRELDWIALNGFNVMLMPVGIESVWQKTLQKSGFTEKEITAFIPGPAFTAWWLMGNLEGWGGPMSKAMIAGQANLAKKIIARMHTLGIQPAIQGFYGMVPTSLKEKWPAARVKVQGSWAGGFTRPDILLPQDSLFGQMAAIYYSELKKLYGSDIHYFAGDLFHEGGTAQGIDLAKTARLVQRTLDKYFPGATWVLQAWQSNPKKELLQGLDKKHVLILELLGEHTTGWDTRKGFEGTPFALCPVSNFGEKAGNFGRLGYFAKEIYMAQHSAYHKLMQGIGIMPEGIDNNPVVYDMVAETAWRQNQVDPKSWISGYIQYRYGVTSPDLEQAWQIFLQTVYDSARVSPDGPPESIFCSRPDTSINIPSTYGSLKRHYDTALFARGVALFAKAENLSSDLKYSQTYQTDKIDFIRQKNANTGLVLFAKMLSDLRHKDIAQFKESYARFRKALLSQNALLAKSKFFRLSRWIRQASNFGENAADKALAIKNAKQQISYWGPDNNPKTDLHDYANKEWAGLLSSLYLQRWDGFYKYQLARLEGNAIQKKPDYYQMEVNWANGKPIGGHE